MKSKKWLFVAIIFAAMVMGFLSMKRALPEQQNERMAKEIKLYSPYTFEKRIGGLTIVDKRDGRKEKPSAAEVYLRMDELNKEWGAKHLRVENSDLIIMGYNNQTVVKVFIQNQDERDYLHHFYGL